MTTRKFLLRFILATLTVGIQAELFKMSLSLKYSEECREELNIPKFKHQELLVIDPADADDNADGKNLMFCVLTKYGLMDKDGDFTLDILFGEGLSRDVEEALKRCSVKMDTPGESAREFLVCVKSELLHAGIYDACLVDIGLKSGEESNNECEKVDPRFKRLSFCLFKKLLLMDAGGGIFMGELRKAIQMSQLTKEEKTQALEKCAGKKDNNFLVCMDAIRQKE